MKSKKYLWSFLTVIMLLSMTVGAALADDGVMYRRNISKTPDQETERANINHMSFYVPAQRSDGTLGSIDIVAADGSVAYTRDFVKPLISVYVDGLHEEEELTKSGAGYGAHDAYTAVSLDDGATWKRTNLSRSADLSSFTLETGEPYPGDAHNMTFTIAGDKVLIGWISKYCDGGQPLYTLSDADKVALAQAAGLEDMYVHDIWGVTGTQKSIDYEEYNYPEVGEIPYSCVWAARGQLVLSTDETTGDTSSELVWTKAERLTSGVRDANRLEMNADSAAGFMMTWQEDPDGLRPGLGLGPGEGWSGAIVNGQTDLWYSFISWNNFDLVGDVILDTDGLIDRELQPTLSTYADEELPKPTVPMSMPIRLTDNAMCKTGGQGFAEYCFIEFDEENPYLTDFYDEEAGSITLSIPGEENGGLATYCESTVLWTNPGGTQLNICVAQDDRIMNGRVGSSRPRVNVQPYATTTAGIYDSAIVIMGAEESKALGEGGTMGADIETDPIDIGKNLWYYSFDLLNPVFVQQGGMLNQPAKCTPDDALAGLCTDGDFYPYVYENVDLDPEQDDEVYETEIARRFSHMSQASHQIGDSGISSVLIVKQGIINQGGPADIFLRLTQVPEDMWSDTCADPDGEGPLEALDKCLEPGFNAYAYENLVCDEWDFLPDALDPRNDGENDNVEINPNYIEGLCISNMINVSGASIVACDGVEGDCADQFPWDGGTQSFPKVTQWVQSGPSYDEPDGYFDDLIEWGTMDDQSWENPYDVAKGHRGIIDGDFIMMMYAWSPNWQANSVGNDHYNLYARRSFDGGMTWTTLPDGWADDMEFPDGVEIEDNGTETCENYKFGTDVNTVCTTYAAGEFEQARNLSQLIGNKITILDPRYSPTGGLKMLPVTDKFNVNGGVLYTEDDIRDPSKYMIVYETGDNTTVAEGEAVPLDLFYSRATNFGDDYDLVELNTPVGEDEDALLGFDWLEHDKELLSGEAANTFNNAGTMYYVVWNQWQEDEHENVSNSDAIFRRIWFNDAIDADGDGEEADFLPIASLLEDPQEIYTVEGDEVISLYISARDLDSLGDDPQIVEYEWLINGQPFLYQDADTDCYQDKQCKAPAKILASAWDGMQFQEPGWAGPDGNQYGWYDFEVRAKDNEGHWTKVLKTRKYVANSYMDSLPRIFVPLLTK
jgi:hypothetical protein